MRIVHGSFAIDYIVKICLCNQLPLYGQHIFLNAVNKSKQSVNNQELSEGNSYKVLILIVRNFLDHKMKLRYADQLFEIIILHIIFCEFPVDMQQLP